jgi:glutaredoxin 3
LHGHCLSLPLNNNRSRTMPPVVIYTTRFCPYCMMAKRLLAKKGAAIQEIDVTGNPTARQALTAKAGGRTTVPQIWIGATHVGGCDELYELDADGKLDPLLAAA